MFPFFFFKDPATTEIYTLSLHDALPISPTLEELRLDLSQIPDEATRQTVVRLLNLVEQLDRKSTRLNSSHSSISYAVFCLKKKKTNANPTSLLFPRRSLGVGGPSH